MANKNPVTNGILKHSKEKSTLAVKKVDEAIKRMIKSKDSINFNSVSTESNISKAFLYKNKDIRKRIEMLRKQQEGLPSPRAAKHEMTDNSKDVLIASLKKRIKTLEDENRDFKERLKIKYGEIYEKI